MRNCQWTKLMRLSWFTKRFLKVLSSFPKQTKGKVKLILRKLSFLKLSSDMLPKYDKNIENVIYELKKLQGRTSRWIFLFFVTSEFPVWISPGSGALFFILKYYEKSFSSLLSLSAETIIDSFYQMVILERNETSHVFKSLRWVKMSGRRESPTAWRFERSSVHYINWR